MLREYFLLFTCQDISKNHMIKLGYITVFTITGYSMNRKIETDINMDCSGIEEITNNVFVHCFSHTTINFIQTYLW